MISLLLLVLLSLHAVEASVCISENFGASSIACRCNSTYCDTFDHIESIPGQSFLMYTSTKSGKRFSKTSGQFSSSHGTTNHGALTIDRSTVYQTVIGFGGAFTDAAGINIHSLSNETQEQLLKSYFSTDGLEYTLARVPIASTDFSTHEYSYDDVADDLSLAHFQLAPEDVNHKLPLLKRAMAMSQKKIKVFSSPWSAPGWMKTNGKMHGRGFLKGQPGGPYFKAWANYLVKFLDAYKTAGIPMWGMTAQNEPTDGRIPFFSFQCMGFTAETQRDFIAKDLGPALAAGGYGDLKLMILDDDLLALPGWAQTIYNSDAGKYVSGLGVHWYLNGVLSYDRLTETHQVNTDKFILATEACAGSAPYETKVILGSWERAEQYTNDIIQDMQNWVTGWTDWNIALNTSGGPNWVNNNVDSPIIVDAANDVFYKQPMFYAMGHFSKLVAPGSVRVRLSVDGASLSGLAFKTPEKRLVLIVYNSGEKDETVSVQDGSNKFQVSIEAHSINTAVWNA